MRILGLCFDSTSAGVPHGHDLGLVALSFVIAAFASYCSLDMAERLNASEGRARAFWLTMAGLTLGGGIWSMHFVAMTAFQAPLEQGYDAGLTLLSGVIAVAAVIAGLSLLGRKPTLARLVASGAGVGAGVVAMHYIGMGALSVPGEIVYRPGLFGLSVLIALTAATVALWLASTVTKIWHRAAAAVAMAVAICGMHYTAMAGTVLIAEPVASHDGDLVSKTLLAALVTVGVAALILIGLVMAFLDRRMANRALDEAKRLREMNAQLDRARADAEAASLAKTRFLATMSHEIRTPMNGVLGMLEVAMRANLDTIVRDQIGTARDSAASLLQILNDILDLSKIEAGQMPIEHISFSPRQEIDKVISVFESQATQKGLRLERVIGPEIPQWIVGDPTRFRQVFINLVGNAFKFTQAGGVRVFASYWTDAGSGRLRIEVKDTGIGIDEEARVRLFTRFSQADASTTRRFGGTGLGLAISRELVLAMGGQIGVDSMPKRGSTFWFELPACEGEAPAGQETRKQASGAARPLRILVAEDNLVNQKVLSALLAPTGHELDFVSDGARAVAAVEVDAFDLVLMDVHMPVMDGLTATRKIRSLSGPAAALPIIALTANAMVGDREVYLAAGMNDYVSKPIRIDDLLAAIARQRRDVPEEASAPLADQVRPSQDAPAPLVASEAQAASLDELLSAFNAKHQAA